MKTLLMVMMCLFTLGAKAQDTTPVLVGDLYYTLDETNLTAETAAMPMEGETQPRYTFTKVTVPATVDYDGKTYNVVKIGNGSLRELPNLTTITLPASVQTIGNSSFAQCPNLTMVSGSNNASVIEDWAFYGCEKLSFFQFSTELKAISEHCFQNCTSLNTVQIPAGVTDIKVCAFQSCEKLTNAAIPEGVTNIGGYAFYGTAIKTATIPGGVKRISGEAFRNCKSLESVVFLEGVERLDGWSFGDCSSLKTIKLPASMTVMEDWVFDNAAELKEVYINWQTPPDPNDPEAAITGIKWWTFGNTDRSGMVAKVPEQYRDNYGETWLDFPVQAYTNTSTIANVTSEQACVHYAAGTLQLFNLNGYEVTVASVNGQRVAAFTANTTGMPLALASGVYVLKATKGANTAIAKVIAQ
jgi:hypothetical protein